MASRRFASVPVYDDHAELDRSERHAPPPALDQAFTAAAGARKDAHSLLCPYCGSDHTVRWGAAHGLPRRRCVSCRRTFNILTNTPLARLRNKDRWLTFAGTLFERKSIRKSAAACGISATTSSRWHHRFTNCSAEQRAKILGAIISAYSNAPALTGVSEDAGAANLQWCRELLPVVLSWIV
ncbi:MAG: IS1 family transposase [Betaproteobacteria bacterium]|nr:MAG: IS1 family transposase [Betaproteobacteria bacterium]